MSESVLTRNQKRSYVRLYTEDGEQYRLTAEVRWDDECGNGHNTFAITGEIHRKEKNGKWVWESGGCIHEEISRRIPELAPLIQWHLCSSDGPMHYIANTVYLAGDRDYNGRTKGERYHIKGREEKRVVFGDFPISFEFKYGFVSFIESVADWSAVEPVAVEHENKPGETYKFEPKWSVTGHNCEWYQCPFDRKEEAEEFLAACRRFSPKVVIYQEKFTRVGEGKERELDAARKAANWPEATDEELTSPGLKERLETRLGTLLLNLRKAVESLGFTW